MGIGIGFAELGVFAIFLKQGVALGRLGLLLLGVSLGQVAGWAAADSIGVFPAEIHLPVNGQQRLLVHQRLAKDCLLYTSPSPRD